MKNMLYTFYLQKKTNIIKCAIAMMAFAFALVLLPSEVKAAKVQWGDAVKIYTGQQHGLVPMDKVDIIKVTSSDESVVSASISDDILPPYEIIFLKAKKQGTATVTCKYKYKGKVKTEKIKITVYKYVNPVKSIKIDGKEIKNLFNNKDNIKYKYKNSKKAKVSITMKKGWKISSIHCSSNSDSKVKSFNKNKKKRITTFKMKGKINYILVYMYNEEQNYTERLLIEAK